MTPRPHGKLAGVPPVVRHLWSLLFRAERRHAELLDRHQAALEAQARALDLLHGELVALVERVARLEDDEGDAS